MGIIGSAVLFFLGIISTAFARQLADEFKEWTPWIVARLIRRAVAKLPKQYQERSDEEWRSHINEVPGHIGKLVVAFGFLSIAQKVGPRKFIFWDVAKRLRENPSFRFCVVISISFLAAIGVVIGGTGSRAIFTPWLLTIIVATWGFLLTLRQERILKIPLLYLAFFTFVAVIQLVSFWHWPHQYNVTFWVCELLHNLMLCLLSLEILLRLPSKFVKLCALPLIGTLIFQLTSEMPMTRTTTILLNLSVSASLAGGALLMMLALTRVSWTKEHRLVACGIVVLLLGEIVPSLLPRTALLGRLVSQFSPMIGLALLSVAGSDRPSENTKVNGTI